MFSKNDTKFLHTTTFRLTLWYLGVFGTLSLAVFGVVYIVLASHLYDLKNTELLDTAMEFRTLYQDKGVSALQDELSREADSQGTGLEFFALISPKGKLLAQSGLDRLGEAASQLRLYFPTTNKPSIDTLTLPGIPHKIRVIALATGDGNVIRVGSTLQGDELVLERYRETFGTALLIMIFCGGLVGWFLARKAMSGVIRVTQTASRIGPHDFTQRVAVLEEGEEIEALVRAFNGMLERIERLVHELLQITDNVAHELRTPITRIRGIAETTLKGNGDIDEFRDMAALVIDGSDDLVEMIGTMLEIARTDTGLAELQVVSLDMGEIVTEAVDLFLPVAEDRNIELQWTRPKQPLGVPGDRSRLQRLVANLLDNAIKYTPAGGRVMLSVVTAAAGVHIIVSDNGVGIREHDIPLIFDRFYRADKSRSTSGSGLGLSLARAIARAHGGDITVASGSKGSTFTVSLPAQRSPS